MSELSLAPLLAFTPVPGLGLRVAGAQHEEYRRRVLVKFF